MHHQGGRAVRNEGLRHGPPAAMIHTNAELGNVKRVLFDQFSGSTFPAWKGQAVELRVMMFGDGAAGARAEFRLVTPKPMFSEVMLRAGPADRPDDE